MIYKQSFPNIITKESMLAATTTPNASSILHCFRYSSVHIGDHFGSQLDEVLVITPL
ncbi:hypothetical protein CA13_14450 [Planctomycetes bacterium CA13]|uniref:Uncharacterized protein n=1 Tax=Novipirellula herctigrandis TaxID=2527986 RepID=A0A5C5Z024_9BACT|nr:hypothetical protein CA13_14450 [Planctomycetes bacterium CA13]